MRHLTLDVVLASVLRKTQFSEISYTLGLTELRSELPTGPRAQKSHAPLPQHHNTSNLNSSVVRKARNGPRFHYNRLCPGSRGLHERVCLAFCMRGSLGLVAVVGRPSSLRTPHSRPSLELQRLPRTTPLPGSLQESTPSLESPTQAPVACLSPLSRGLPPTTSILA